MRVRKAVIAVAGYGTRFLPATKVVPKELLCIVDKPIVQYLVEEAVESGIEDVILVVREGTQAIADHFDSTRALEVHLAEQGKDAMLERIRAISRMASFALVRQGSHLPYGNGTPILAAKPFLGDEPFVYMFGDDLVLSETPCVRQILDLYDAHQPAAILAAQNVPREETSRYGVAALRAGTTPPELERIVEKPSPDEAPSTLAQLGRFVLTPQVVERLEPSKVAKGEELYLTPALDALAQKERVLVHEIEGIWHTTGDPLRFMKANVEYMLRDPELGPDLRRYLKGLAL